MKFFLDPTLWDKPAKKTAPSPEPIIPAPAPVIETPPATVVPAIEIPATEPRAA